MAHAQGFQTGEAESEGGSVLMATVRQKVDPIMALGIHPNLMLLQGTDSWGKRSYF